MLRCNDQDFLGPASRVAALTLGLLWLGACSNSPIFKDMLTLPTLSGFDEVVTLQETDADAGIDADFPNLATVPNAARPRRGPEQAASTVSRPLPAPPPLPPAVGAAPAPPPPQTAARPAPAPRPQPAPPRAAPTPKVKPDLSLAGLVARPLDPAARAAAARTVTSDGPGPHATLFFASGSARVAASEQAKLETVARLWHERGGRLRIVGHASMRTLELSPERHKMVNFDISVRRARAVGERLIALGVDRNRLTLEAMGDSEVLFHEYMPSGEAGNRRAEIYFVF